MDPALLTQVIAAMAGVSRTMTPPILWSLVLCTSPAPIFGAIGLDWTNGWLPQDQQCYALHKNGMAVFALDLWAPKNSTWFQSLFIVHTFPHNPLQVL
jgi:hypothetical protein